MHCDQVANAGERRAVGCDHDGVTGDSKKNYDDAGVRKDKTIALHILSFLGSFLVLVCLFNLTDTQLSVTFRNMLLPSQTSIGI